VAPATDPPATDPPIALFDPVPAQDHLVAITNNEGWREPFQSRFPYSFDPLNDTFLPHDGSPSNADQPWIDYTGATGFEFEVSPGMATALSAHLCGGERTANGLDVFVACNQSGPLPAGDYFVFVIYTGQALPDPFPDPAQCVYIVQTDLDSDRSTGFQSQLPYNHLIGADVYFENLFFWGQDDVLRNYILATDHREPARPDTGEVHGNLPTLARWFLSRGVSTDGSISVLSAWIPQADFAGDTWSVGGFCNSDRSSSVPDTYSVDAFGDVTGDGIVDYFDFVVGPSM
jgi:hypothetical protein